MMDDLAGSLMAAIYSSVATIMLPKQVVIQNFRLGLVLLILRLCAFAFVLWLIVGNKSGYLKQAQPIGYVVNWIDSPDEDYTAQANSDMSSELCTNSSKFDYLYAEGWSYSGYTCVTRSKSDRVGWKEGESMMYIPLSYSEAVYQSQAQPAGGCGNITGSTCATGWKTEAAVGVKGAAPVCTCKESGYYFITGVASLSVGLEHYYEFKSNAPFGRSSKQSSAAGCVSGDGWVCESGGDGKEDEMLTLVVTGAEEKVIHKSVSPAPINIPLAKALKEAGISLDDYNKLTTPNMFKCGNPGVNASNCRSDVAPFALVRQTGMQLRFALEYFNNQMYTGQAHDEVKGHKGPICMIRLDLQPRWAGNPRSDCSDPPNSKTSQGSCRETYNYGIQIVFTIGGKFGYFDPSTMLSTLGSGFMYILIPISIISFLMLNCLGPFSKVYKAAVRQDVDLTGEMANLSVNVLRTQAALSHIAVEGGSRVEEGTFISKVSEAFKSDSLDAAEREHLARIVWMKFQDERDQQAAAAGMGRTSQDHHIDTRTLAAHASEWLSLEDVVQIFDKDRKRGLVEAMLGPSTQGLQRRSNPSQDVDLEAKDKE